MKINNNKGITLVELIISIGIFSVVMVALFNVLLIATRSFSKNNTEIQLQNEAQSLMNKLDNLIAPAKYGVDTSKNEASNTYAYIINDDSYQVVWNDISKKDVYIYEGSSTDYISVPSTVTTDVGIYQYKLGKAQSDYSSYISSIDIEANKVEYLLAEGVDKFDLNADNNYGYVSVSLRVKDEYSNSNFAASKNINMRNITKDPVVTSTSSSKTNPLDETTTEEDTSSQKSTEKEITTQETTTQETTTQETTTSAAVANKDDFEYVLYTIHYNVKKAGGSWMWQVSGWGDSCQKNEDSVVSNKIATIQVSKYNYYNASGIVKSIPSDLNSLISGAWGPEIEITDLQIEFLK